MPNIGPIELIVILVIALIVIGPGRLPDVGAALGKSIKEFRKASSDLSDVAKVDTSPLPPAATEAPAAVAAPIAPAAVAAPIAPAVAAPAAAPAPQPEPAAPVPTSTTIPAPIEAPRVDDAAGPPA